MNGSVLGGLRMPEGREWKKLKGNLCKWLPNKIIMTPSSFITIFPIHCFHHAALPPVRLASWRWNSCFCPYVVGRCVSEVKGTWSVHLNAMGTHLHLVVQCFCQLKCQLRCVHVHFFQVFIGKMLYKVNLTSSCTEYAAIKMKKKSLPRWI